MVFKGLFATKIKSSTFEPFFPVQCSGDLFVAEATLEGCFAVFLLLHWSPLGGLVFCLFLLSLGNSIIVMRI